MTNYELKLKPTADNKGHKLLFSVNKELLNLDNFKISLTIRPKADEAEMIFESGEVKYRTFLPNEDVEIIFNKDISESPQNKNIFNTY